MHRQRVAIYHRPTMLKGADPVQEVQELRNYALARNWDIVEYLEKARVNVKDTNCPALKRLLRDIKGKKVDMVLCHSLINLAYSMKHLLATLDRLNVSKIAFIAVKDGIDMDSPTGNFVNAVMRMQKGLSGISISLGMNIARLRNVVIGRPPIAPDQAKRIIDGHEAKMTIRAIAKSTLTPPASVFKTVKMFKNGEIGRNGERVSAA